MSAPDMETTRREWFGAQAAARFLGVHRSTLHVAVRQRLIIPDGHTPGGHVRFRRETLQAFRERLAGGQPIGSAARSFTAVRVLADLARMTAAAYPVEQVSHAAVTGILSTVPGIDMCCIYVRTDDPVDRFHLRVAAQQGFPEEVFTNFHKLRSTFRFATTVCLRTLEPEVVEDVTKQQLHTGTERLQRWMHLGAYAILPIYVGDEGLGVLVCASHAPRSFGEQDMLLLRGISDSLAALLNAGAKREQLTAALAATRNLFTTALTPVEHTSDDVLARLCSDFRQLTGATDICALGFGRDTLPSNARLAALACAACAGDAPAHDQWSEGGTLHSALAASIPLRSGQRGGVAAVWRGSRRQREADHALLMAFAGGYLLALGLE